MAAAALDPDLAQAVARAQAGDAAAFDTIYERFADPLFRFVYVRCGDAALAEELTGDLWVRVVEKLPSFQFPRGEPEAAFAGWLYTIARNLVIDNARRRRHEHSPLTETLSSNDASPDERALAGEEHRELRNAIEKLTPDQRTVVLLRFVEDRSNADVARLMEKTEGAVKLLQYRALDALARTMGGRRKRGSV
jgi:RNA polymerase sigma-70 factor, ECF subfamily